jgi:hypothetical protein
MEGPAYCSHLTTLASADQKGEARPSIPSDRACKTARCHASAWPAALAEMLFSLFVPVTSDVST